MRSFLGGLKVLVVAMLVNALANPAFLRLPVELRSEAEAAAPLPGYDVPGFGGATAPPRMLIIMDTSKSMSSTPDMTQNLPLQDYDGEADSVDSAPICGEDPDTVRYPNSAGWSAVPGIPPQDTGAFQGQPLTLTCPAGQHITAIDWAAYGKRVNNVSGVAQTPASATFDPTGSPCAMANINAMTDNLALDGTGHCNNSGSTQQSRAGVSAYRGWLDIKPKVQSLCVGQESCTFLADDSLAGDPCFGTGPGKYALVKFRCSTDPCPPGSGSKFCIAKKALHRIISDNAANTLDMAAGGYFQTMWSQVHPAITSNYATDCAYDVIAKTTTNTNANLLWIKSDTEFGPVGTPAAAGAHATFACHPEAMSGVTDAHNAYPAGCLPQTGAHSCDKSFTSVVAGPAAFQHEDVTHRTEIPTGGPGSWSWGGSTPPDKTLEVPPRFWSSADSYWDVTHPLLVRAADVGGSCLTAPDTFADVPSTPPPASATYPGDCTAGNRCTFFNQHNSLDFPIQQTTVWRDLGAPPQLVRGLIRNFVNHRTDGAAWLPVSEVGGSVCPATVAYTGTMGFWPSCGPGDNQCDLTRVGSTDVPTTSYSCTFGYTPTADPTLCNATRNAFNANLTIGSYARNASADVWEPFYYTLDLAAVASGSAHCYDGTDDTWTSNTFPTPGTGLLTSVTGLGCGATDASFPGRCAIRGASPLSDFATGPIRGVPSTDGQLVTCKIERLKAQYVSTVPAIATDYCQYSREIYNWYNLEARCEYRRFVYNYTKKSFVYTWPYLNDDFAGTVLAAPTYAASSTPSDQYCSTTRPISALNPSFTSVGGFGSAPDPVKCAAQIAAGTSGCPADAKFCKLRWGSAGNRRFNQFTQSTWAHPKVNPAMQPGVGCAVGDPASQFAVDPANNLDYAPNWSDWCYTNPSLHPATPQTTDAPRLIADLYNESVTGNNFTAPYWGGAPINSSHLDTFSPALHGMKDRGLSVSDIYPPTAAISFADFGTPKVDLLKLFQKFGAGGDAVGLRMPELGNITPLTGALKNALEFLRQTKLADPSGSCRRYSILLVTDGNEDPVVAGGLAAQAAAANAAGVNVYVVGFGIQSSTLDTFTRAVGTAVDAAGNSDNVAGHAYNASDYPSLLRALNQIVGAQLSGFYTRSKPTVTSDAKRLYAAYFAHATGGAGPLEYAGYLDAYAVSSTGVALFPEWKFDSKLHTQTSPVSPTASTLPRKLYTRTHGSTSLVDFDVASSCSGTSQDLVEDITTLGACGVNRDAANEIIKFVRNDRASPDDATYNDGSVKVSRVSDIYHSQPTAMYAPYFSSAYTAPAPYTELGGRGPALDPAAPTTHFNSGAFTLAYAAYKAATVTRETTVFVGSNTGTVHAIRDHVTDVQPWRGEERWAFVPHQLLPSIGSPRVSGHTWLADGSFGLSEVCFGKGDCEDSTGAGWKAMLVGTTGRGGPFMYALNVTDITSPSWMWDYNSNPAAPADTNLGETWSAPTIARVRVDDDYYKWGVFMGGGFSDDTSNPHVADYFYVLDADPASRSGKNAVPLEDSGHHQAKWEVDGANQVYNAAHALVSVRNKVPARPRVMRPIDGSRASRVYFGDTNGVLWSMDVSSKHINNWRPKKLFNPFRMHDINSGASDEASCRAPIKTLPDHAAATVTMAAGAQSLPWPDLTLPSLYNRPLIGLDENTSATMIYVGSGDATNALDMGTTNYFWAVEDTESLQTGSSSDCTSKLRWGYVLNQATGEKVLSEPAIIGKNIIVAVYTPPAVAASLCGAAGYSTLYCFDRLTGVAQNCLVDTSSSPIDSTAATFGGRARFVRVGQPGILSDLQAVGNKVVFTSSGAPDHPGSIDASENNTPFRIKSWKRVR